MSTSILVADDSLYARMVLKNVVMEILDSVDFSDATSGVEALDLAAAEQFDFDYYLLDINMAGKDGLEVSDQLLAAGVAPSKIALVTGNRSTEFKTRAAETGVSYIEKAVSPKDMEPFQQRLRAFLIGAMA